MNFIMWLFKRIKNSKFEWVTHYRRVILQDKALSILLTFAGGLLYICLVASLLIPFSDRADTVVNTMVGAAGSVVMFYVYHWIMALHEVYLLERQKTWNALSKR